MSLQKDRFFRTFQPELRPVLQKFFDNRQSRITPDLVEQFADSATVQKLIGLQWLEFDLQLGEYRLDDRVERFFEEMLGSVESTHSDWLSSYLEELKRLIGGYQKLLNQSKTTALFRNICRLMKSCISRTRYHLEDLKAAVDYDYRAGAEYEVKLMKLQWHLDRAKSFGVAIAAVQDHVRNDSFFHVHQELDLLTLRSQLIHTCTQVGEALIDVYQRIEDYLNRIIADYQRARKLIHLRALIDRHEYFTSTNLEEVAEAAGGPWFREFRFRTLLTPQLLDERPTMLQRAFARAGVSPAPMTARKVRIDDSAVEELPPMIDWSEVFNAFVRQEQDLFRFLSGIQVESRRLSEEERVNGYCTILCSHEMADASQHQTYEVSSEDGWEYAVVHPPRSMEGSK